MDHWSMCDLQVVGVSYPSFSLECETGLCLRGQSLRGTSWRGTTLGWFLVWLTPRRETPWAVDALQGNAYNG